MLFSFLLCLYGFCGLDLVLCEPVNRDFTAALGKPTPHQRCWVGIASLEVTELKIMNCSEAENFVIKVPTHKKDLMKKFGMEPLKKFGVQSNGEPWPKPVKSWVCVSKPHMATITKDCLPENVAPWWFAKKLPGPAPAAFGRAPGCNGFHCYCNIRQACNDNNIDT